MSSLLPLEEHVSHSVLKSLCLLRLSVSAYLRTSFYMSSLLPLEEHVSHTEGAQRQCLLKDL